MNYKLRCPDCGHRLRIRSSTGQHLLLRAEYIQCLNPACGATFRGQREITHRLSPSGMPNPAVCLPSASAALRERVAGEFLGIDDQLDWVNQNTCMEQPENAHE